MHWNKLIRVTHRWLSVAFTVAVTINLVTVLKGRYSNSLGLMAVAVLALQFFTGMYLFVLPYANKWLGARNSH